MKAPNFRTPSIAASLFGLALASACSSTEPSSPPEEAPLAACAYTSPFTQGEECREYFGDAWTSTQLTDACDALSGTLELDAPCAVEDLLGRCDIDRDTAAGLTIFAYGDLSAADASAGCAGQKMGCEVFGGGTWRPEPICEGGTTTTPSTGNVFVQPTLECREPLAGEPAGQSADGQVCTWQAISGSTEEGRKFNDYASCDVVRTQRPYYPAAPADGHDAPDTRLDDPGYVAELSWVKSQIEASACVCCHADESPDGASNWNVDAPGNWINTFRDSGLALGANYVSSEALGTYPAEENNGFERETSGFPSTDPQRMRAFFIAELEHRGRTVNDFADTPPFGGPIYDQLQYEPAACDDGVGVNSDGSIVWEGGDARYVYVLDAGSDNPTVPPNLDLPSGTRWRVDVPATGDPITSGDVVYGVVPENTTQRFPDASAPIPLVPGTTYYLYVSQDVGIPITRCHFEL